MNDTLKYIILAIATILGQILMNEFINIWPLFHLFIYPFFLISLPISMNRFVYMIIAVLFGLGIDLFIDGVLGLNGLACLVMAYFRRAVIGMQFPISIIEGLKRISIEELGIFKYLITNVILYAIFIIVYTLLDTLYSSSFIVVLFWIVINIISSVFVACALETTFMNRFSSKFNG